jgi:D-beta-D-heptose 7-phosphate kinase/D-beta-D-heptose 1-phosphate adenosyltransferase
MEFDLDKIEDFANVKVLCIGDIMLDTFVKGTVTRISPEAPIPVLRKISSHSMLGGVGNVASNINTIGAQVGLISVVGDDANAQTIKKLCSDLKLIDLEIIKDPSRRSTKKSRFISSQQQILRVDEEDVHFIDAPLINRISTKVKEIIAGYDILLISDYAKGVCSPELIQQCIELARNKKIPVVIDPKNDDYRVYAGAHVITPNQKELAQAAGQPIQTELELVNCARTICDKFAINNLVITRAAEGMTIVSSNLISHLPTKAKEICDVSGAGDTVIATIAVCLGADFSLAQAAEIANTTAGLVVSKFGTATVTKEELLQALQQSKNMWQSKIIGREKAKEIVEEWHAKGLSVGFTNGCFDLLHPGHIKIIHEARSQCQKLVMGLNTDDSIRRLKGPDRPVQNEEARAIVLAALHDIDLVVLFDEDTPLELISLLVPDVLVKGADYTVDKVVGGDIVKQNGGRVHLVELLPDISTTAMIKKAGSKEVA